MSDTPTPSPTPKARGKTLLLAAGVAGMLTAGGGVYFWMSRHGGVEAAAHVERGIVGLQPFVVNLADDSASRFLRVTVQLVLADESQAARLEQSKVALLQARSAVLELLTVQKSDRLVTPEGKTALRAAIVEEVTQAIHPFEVVDVLFSDFVVQF